MKVKQKRYYIDKSEGNKIIFVTTGRINKFVRDIEMHSGKVIHENNGSFISFDEVEIQKEHSCSGYNVDYCDIEERELQEVGLDTPYRFFWSKCVKSNNPHRQTYSFLFGNLKHQTN